MAQVQNSKKGSVKGKKGKKGSPTKRSLFFKPATIILALLTTLLLVLGIVYLARVQYWFASPDSKPKAHKSSVAPSPVKETQSPAVKTGPVPVEEYHNIPPSHRAVDRETLLQEEGPLVAIIVDDLGADLGIMKDFLSLQLNLTAAVLPNVLHARAVAELAHTDGLEVLLHVPMEPRDYPAVDPGEEALMVDLSMVEVKHRLRGYLQTVPWVVGANNHMGSRFTESHEGMRAVLEVLQGQGLFFVDSRTSADSVAIAEAERIGIAHAERDLFLDNDINEEAIRRQIRKLIGIAKEQGSAIGICHPHLETYTALKKESPSFAASGVKLVGVSALLH